MKDLWINLLGVSATVLSAASLMPQVMRTWRTRSAADISATYLIVALTAAAIWIGYAILIDATVLIVVNVIGFSQAATILYVKLRYSRPSPAIAEAAE